MLWTNPKLCKVDFPLLTSSKVEWIDFINHTAHYLGHNELTDANKISGQEEQRKTFTFSFFRTEKIQ